MYRKAPVSVVIWEKLNSAFKLSWISLLLQIWIDSGRNYLRAEGTHEQLVSKDFECFKLSVTHPETTSGKQHKLLDLRQSLSFPRNVSVFRNPHLANISHSHYLNVSKFQGLFLVLYILDKLLCVSKIVEVEQVLRSFAPQCYWRTNTTSFVWCFWASPGEYGIRTAGIIPFYQTLNILVDQGALLFWVQY